MAYDIRVTPFAQARKRWERELADRFADGYWASPPDPTAKRIAQQPAQQNAFSEQERERVAERLRQTRLKLTGFSTKAEQDAQLELAEQQALQQPEGENA